MPFHFVCPYCYKRTLVDESLAGQSGPCAGCGKEITVPVPPSRPSPEGSFPADSAYVDAPAGPFKGRLATWIVKGTGLLVLVAALGSLTIFLLWPVFTDLKQRRDRIACMNNLRQIADALNAYAADYGTYPPPVVYDAAGKPMHSWRVLILNHLGLNSLYAQYNFDQPWDSQENAMLIANCPDVYVSPAAGNATTSESTYMLVTGKGTLFPASGPLRPGQIGDGREQTLLVVEVDNGMHEWTKPADIDVAKLNHKIGATGPNTLGGNHAGGANAAFADGRNAWLPSDLDPVLLDAMISANGGEPLDPEDYRFR